MSLRLWFDVLTPKQVLFFSPLIQELTAQGHDVLATSRIYREVEPLARMRDLDLRYVGARGGSDPKDQLLAATERQKEIIPVVTEFDPQVSVSVASGVCARVSFGLGIKHVAVNDSPHSTVAGKLSLPISYHLLCPWIIPFGAWARFGLKRNQISRYRALDPAAWLKRKSWNGPMPKLSPKKSTITVRLEETYAPYMAGTNRRWSDSVLGAIAKRFPTSNLVALCRYGDQLEEVKNRFGSDFIVPDEVVDGRSLLEVTDLFVGMGGTMSAEAALMGVPTISTFQGSLYTERYLASERLLMKTRDPDRLMRLAARLLGPESKRKHKIRAKKVLARMEDPVEVIGKFLTDVPTEG